MEEWSFAQPSDSAHISTLKNKGRQRDFYFTHSSLLCRALNQLIKLSLTLLLLSRRERQRATSQSSGWRSIRREVIKVRRFRQGGGHVRYLSPRFCRIESRLRRSREPYIEKREAREKREVRRGSKKSLKCGGRKSEIGKVKTKWARREKERRTWNGVKHLSLSLPLVPPKNS